MSDYLSYIEEWVYRNPAALEEQRPRFLLTTLDNPGWAIDINLRDTELETLELDLPLMEMSEHNWHTARARDHVLELPGGPWNLFDLLEIFRRLAESRGAPLPDLDIVPGSAREEPPGLLSWLAGYFIYHCNGDWEHDWTFLIQSIPGPAWEMEFYLEGTVAWDLEFETVEHGDSEEDRHVCWLDNDIWRGRGGPRSLGAMLGVFREAIEANLPEVDFLKADLDLDYY